MENLWKSMAEHLTATGEVLPSTMNDVPIHTQPTDDDFTWVHNTAPQSDGYELEPLNLPIDPFEFTTPDFPDEWGVVRRSFGEGSDILSKWALLYPTPLKHAYRPTYANKIAWSWEEGEENGHDKW